MAEKWNYKTHSYEPYKLPKGACMTADDMSRVISCAECGRAVTFGKSYVSMQIHNHMGLGYMVCGQCYEVEKGERLHALLGDN